MSLVGTALAAVASAIAAGVPLLTFVYTYTLKARVEMRIGEEIILHYTSNMHLILTTDFIFLNRGAQQAAITGVFGTVWRGTDPHPKSPNLAWEKYEKTLRPEADRPYQTRSTAIVEPIVIPGRSAFNARMRLYSTIPLRLESTDGCYFLKLESADGSSKLKSASSNYILHLSEHDAGDLLSNAVEQGGNFRVRISLRRIRATPDLTLMLPFAGWPNSPFNPKKPKRFVTFESTGRWIII
jgi:hypothetical protein